LGKITRGPSPLLQQATELLQRARKEPPGPHRNDLRQLATALLKMYRSGIRANVSILEYDRPDHLN
jgi:hypothetical protein